MRPQAFGASILQVLFLLVIIQFPMGKGGWKNNLFHQMVTSLVNKTQTDCWVCTHGPSSYQQGWPILPGPMLTLVAWNKTSIYNFGPSPQKPLHDRSQFILTRRGRSPMAPLCVQWDNTSRYGYSYSSRTGSPGYHRTPIKRINLGYYDNCNVTVPLFDTPQGRTHTCSYYAQTFNLTPPFDCFTDKGTQINVFTMYKNQRGHNPLIRLQDVTMHNGAFLGGLPLGFYWVCGDWAGKLLPPVWRGRCTIGTLRTAGLQMFPKEQPKQAWDKQFWWRRKRREYDDKLGYDPDSTYLSEGERFGAILFPWVGVGLNVRQIRRLSAQVERLANTTLADLQALQTEVDSLAGMLFQHKLALDYLLSREGGLCVWLNTTCCHYINKSGDIEEDVEKLHDIVSTVRSTYSRNTEWWSWLTSWLPDFHWLKTLFVGLLLFLFVCFILLMCLPCLMSCFRHLMQNMLDGMFMAQTSKVQRLMYVKYSQHSQAQECGTSDPDVTLRLLP